jgi:hypothetical protein
MDDYPTKFEILAGLPARAGGLLTPRPYRGKRESRLLLSPAAAERVSESEHDDFGDGDALDEQEGAIGAEDPQRAFDLAPPVKRQFAGYDFDELKICVRSCREEGRVPPPGRDDNGESADERSTLECAVSGRSADEYQMSIHDWSTVGPPFQLGLSPARHLLIGTGSERDPVAT